MKKLILLLSFILACTGISVAQTEGNKINAAGQREGHWIITGKLASNKAYSADAKVEEGNYIAGSKTGVWIFYFPTGTKKAEYTYVNNRPNGHAVTYFENGNKMEEGTWVGSRWVGEYQM